MITKATEKDIQTIQNVAKESWNSAYTNILEQKQLDYMLDLMYSQETLKTHFENPNYQYYLIQEDEVFLGFIGFEFHKEPETTKLHRIYFLKEAQGKGLGKKALEFVKYYSVTNHFKVVLLEIENHNERAKKLYEHYGFQNHKRSLMILKN